MKNANYLTVYLAGSCKNEEDEGRGWRSLAVDAFRKIDRYDELKSCVIDPTRYFSYSDTNITDKQVKAFYFSKIKDCDVVLVSLANSAVSPGTAQEVQFAVDSGIPIIGIRGENEYPWIANVDCDVVFNTLKEAIGYIKKYYMESAQPLGQIKKDSH